MPNYKTLFDEIKGGIGISSMVNITNGKFCGDYGKGSAMVQIGGYVRYAQPRTGASLVLGALMVMKVTKRQLWNSSSQKYRKRGEVAQKLPSIL